MWIVVGMANSRKTAIIMKKTLEAEGILVRLRDVSGRIKSSDETYEVIVLESEAETAKEILFEHGM